MFPEPTDRERIELCLKGEVEIADIVTAILDGDDNTLADMRAARSAQKAIAQSYLDAYDAAKDDTERKAVVCVVRADRAFSSIEHEIKAAELRNTKI